MYNLKSKTVKMLYLETQSLYSASRLLSEKHASRLLSSNGRSFDNNSGSTLADSGLDVEQEAMFRVGKK